MEIIFDVPQKELGYYIENVDNELTVNLYKLKEKESDKQELTIPYQALLTIDLSQYDKIHKIKVYYL